MYTEIHIQNFRLFQDLKLESLGRVNLIAGKNNTGKTSLLDVIAILNRQHLQKDSDALRLQIDSIVLPFETLYYDFKPTKVNVIHAKIVGYDNWFSVFINNNKSGINGGNGHSSEKLNFHYVWAVPGEKREAEYVTSVSEDNKLQHQLSTSTMSDEPFMHKIEYLKNAPPPVTVEADAYTRLALRVGKKQIVVEALKSIDPRLSNIELLAPNGVPLIYADLGLSQSLSISTLGEGIRRLLNILVAIGNTENGIILIDEIENGLHYSVLSDVWKAIGKAARDFNVQVFATTHSFECIEAAHKAFSEDKEYDFRLHRLERAQKTGIRAVTYKQDTLEAAIEMDFEVR